MSSSSAYRIVRLRNGAHSVHSLAHHETFHPVVGPVAEAEALYVGQLNVVERLRGHRGDFAIWDVGLGAAANPLTFLRATRELACSIHIISFDHTLEPLDFALRNTDALPYLKGREPELRRLLEERKVTFRDIEQRVKWEVQVADFPTFLAQAAAPSGKYPSEPSSHSRLPKPHVVMFDAFSPATNPTMWTQQVFSNLFALLDPERPCALPTYSRSTMLRVTLLLAGFYVGVGHATGEKEETTIAANTLELIREPLDRRWLQRVHRSTSAEPLHEPVYRQAPLSSERWSQLQNHRQFSV